VLDDDVLDEDVEETWAERWERYFKVTVGATSLLLLNEAITRFFELRAITFSPPLAGMILTIAALCATKAIGGKAGESVDNLMRFYEPLRNWVARWMPVFFVPSLIALPRAAADIAGSEMVKMVGVTVVGWLASILVSITLLKVMRGAAHSEITTDEVCLQFGLWSRCAQLSLACTLVHVAADLSTEPLKRPASLAMRTGHAAADS
jgi:putative effector of murein hydrolase LrgA (UPF0299 family)